MSTGHTDILMYHSISDAAGPTSISPTIFAAQMAAIAEAGVPVISMDEVAARHSGDQPVPYAIAITFDDGFQDFADVAWPVLQSHGFGAMVYLPSGCIGGNESWRGAHVPPRPLMDWAEIRELTKAGVTFGSHTVSHPDLTKLSAGDVSAELRKSREALEDRLGMPVSHFAPPYGQTTLSVRQVISAEFQTSVGTRLGSVNQNANLFDLPRLEMFYFTDMRHWRRHLTHKGNAYLTARGLLRQMRETLSKPWEQG